MNRRPLAVTGNVNVDIIIGPSTPWPMPGTEVLVDHGEIRVGGAAGNVALTWQALDVPFQIAANTGNDQFGQWLRDAFPAHSDAWPIAASATTFSVGVTHPDGERTFFTIPGHMPQLSLANVQKNLDIGALKGGIAMIVGSYLTDALTNDYDGLFAWLRQNDVDVALDTGWPIGGWTPATTATTRDWLRHCQHILLNEVEATALTATSSVNDAMREISAIMPRGCHLVVKCGKAGASGLHDGKSIEIPAPTVTPIDTIGAGDVFDAAYLAEISAGRPFGDAIEAGIKTASHAIATLPREYKAA